MQRDLAIAADMDGAHVLAGSLGSAKCASDLNLFEAAWIFGHLEISPCDPAFSVL
jgi:hypothetical protein